MDETPRVTKEQKAEAEKKWMEKYYASPHGILIYSSAGEPFNLAKHLGIQAICDVLVGLIAAVLLGQVTSLKSYPSRVILVMVLGLIPFFAVNVPYWNWYGFPEKYTMIQLVDKLARFLVAGLVLAAMIKPTASALPAAAP